MDGTGEAYRALALGRTSLLRLLRPRLLREALAARREGHRQTAVVGDAWQLGGTLVVAPGDRVLFAWRNAGPEDDAPLDDVLAALPTDGAAGAHPSDPTARPAGTPPAGPPVS